MATKTFKVALSLDNPRIIQSGITVQSFDKQSVKISIALTKDSQTYQIPIGATIRISLLKLSNQAQKIIVDVPNNNRESIDWIVPDYLDGYHGVVRCGVYLLHGTESVDLGYFTILSNVSDIDKMAEEFTDNVFGGWEAIEEELRELNITIAQTKLGLAEDTTQVNNAIANINAKNTQVNTLASNFADNVATKQADVTSKYNAFDTSVTQAGQTIDDILALQPQFQLVLDETTGKDVISAPEVILARGGATTLGDRLDNEKAEVTAQLAQKAQQTDLETTNTNIAKKADKIYVDTQIQSVVSGSPKGAYATLTALQTAFPTGNSNIYLVTADGKWYYWNGSAWTAGGIYQSAGIGENSVSYVNLKDSVYRGFDLDKTALKHGYNKMIIPTWDFGAISGVTGQNEGTDATRVRTKDFIVPSSDIRLQLNNNNYRYALYTYDLVGTYLGESGWSTSQIRTLNATDRKYKLALSKLDNTVITQTDIDSISGILFLLEGESPLLTTSTPDKVYDALRNSAFQYGAKSSPSINWILGTLNNGKFENLSTRLVTESFITPDDDLVVRILNLDGTYRCAIHTYDSAGTHLANSGWVTSTKIVMPYVVGRKYKIVFAKSPDGSAITDINAFAKNISVTIGYLALGESHLSSDLNSKISKIGGIDLIGLKKKYVGITCRMGYAPQNSLEAIKMSKHAGAFGVEMDVRLTADNDIVLAHNALANTLVNETAGLRVADYTLAQLKTFDVNTGGYGRYDYPVKLASLDEALDACQKYGLVPFIDIKDDNYESTNQTLLLDTLLAKLKNHRMLNSSVLISTQKNSLLYLRENAPFATLSVKRYIEETTVESDIAFAKEIGGNLVFQGESRTLQQVTPEVLTPARISAYHNEGWAIKDVDFIFTFEADNEDRPSTRYWANVYSGDGGNTWEVVRTSPQTTVTLSKTNFSSFDTLEVNFENIEWNLLDILRPQIYVNDNRYPNMTIKGFYNQTAKSVGIVFSMSGQPATFGTFMKPLFFTVVVEF